MRMIRTNFRAAIGVNTALFVAASAGSLSPIAAAVLHNGTTLALLGRALYADTFPKYRRLKGAPPPLPQRPSL
jgi:cation transport ATPase